MPQLFPVGIVFVRQMLGSAVIPMASDLPSSFSLQFGKPQSRPHEVADASGPRPERL